MYSNKNLQLFITVNERVQTEVSRENNENRWKKHFARVSSPLCFFFCSFSFFHFFSPFPRTTTDMQLHGKLKNVMEPRTIDLLFLVKYLYLIFRWIQRQGIGVPCRENDRLYTMKRQNIMQ